MLVKRNIGRISHEIRCMMTEIKTGSSNEDKQRRVVQFYKTHRKSEERRLKQE